MGGKGLGGSGKAPLFRQLVSKGIETVGGMWAKGHRIGKRTTPR